jgi:two-component system chemotaxis response regulator CheY
MYLIADLFVSTKTNLCYNLKMNFRKPNIHPQLKILIVDDCPHILEKMRNILLDIGFKKIDEAITGEQAWAFLKIDKSCGEPYDLVITDINMPIMNGLKLLRKMKKDPDLKEIPVFMVTTRDEMDVVLKAIELGAKNYLIKPFNEQKIKKKILEIFY